MSKRRFLTVAGLVLLSCGWLYIVCRFTALRLFTFLLPPLVVFQCSRHKRLRYIAITIFVVLWMLFFHYESLRAFYLNPLFRRDLPKTKFLFPPAGWIMFYTVDETYSYVEVCGRDQQSVQEIDPHEIFRVRTIGFDNIHRNVLGAAAQPGMAASFCRYLERRFPYYDDFFVTAVYYPSLKKEPQKRFEKTLYQCREGKASPP